MPTTRSTRTRSTTPRATDRAGSTAAIQVRFCATCQREVTVEQPQCQDGHGLGCPEWYCVECGDAFVAGFDLMGDLVAPARAGRAAEHVA
ncbi:MAG: hypothetical protein QOE01_1730 [Actinomycetota bacterium]|nr:hypothetical protein [Actinomycetota bacterium]